MKAMGREPWQTTSLRREHLLETQPHPRILKIYIQPAFGKKIINLSITISRMSSLLFCLVFSYSKTQLFKSTELPTSVPAPLRTHFPLDVRRKNSVNGRSRMVSEKEVVLITQTKTHLKHKTKVSHLQQNYTCEGEIDFLQLSKAYFKTPQHEQDSEQKIQELD